MNYIIRRQMSLAQICWLYGLSLTPIPPFTWLGASISTLDVLAALRLCAIMRQIREAIRQGQSEASEGGVVVIEESSFVKHACATLTVVYGGEVFTGGDILPRCGGRLWPLTVKAFGKMQRLGWASRHPSSSFHHIHCYISALNISSNRYLGFPQ